MVTEPTDQGVNQTNNDFLKAIGVGKIKDRDEPEKTNPDTLERSWP